VIDLGFAQALHLADRSPDAIGAVDAVQPLDVKRLFGRP
jgi:hypothetical protein